MTAQELLGRKPQRKKGKPVQKWYEFERQKREYLALYPYCTSIEYEQAIRLIAQRIGV